MYRDAPDRVDEHDRAAGAILVAEAALASCELAVSRIGDPAAPSAERWQAVGTLSGNYGDLWRHLDRARRELARRGANTIAFDEARPDAPRSAMAQLGKLANKAAVDASHVDRVALDAAHRAVDALKLALPGTDWAEIEARSRVAVNDASAFRQHRRPRLLVGIGATLLVALILGGFTVTSTPAHARDASTAVSDMTMSIEQIRSDRHAQIATIEAALPCPGPAQIHKLLPLMLHDGRKADAIATGTRYLETCGNDQIVEDFLDSLAPLPPRPQVVRVLHGYDVPSTMPGFQLTR